MGEVSISGWALRLNGQCEEGATDCGVTAHPYRGCCPHGSSCPSQYNIACCPFGKNCTESLVQKPYCANSRWNMYNNGGYFCCLPGETGLATPGGSDACVEPGFQTEQGQVVLSIIPQERASSTSSSSSSSPLSSSMTTIPSAAATSSSAPAPARMSSSSNPNTGAIAGGVVGGLALLACVAMFCWWLLRRRRVRTQAPLFAQPGAQQQEECQVVFGRRSELPGMQSPTEVNAKQTLWEMPARDNTDSPRSPLELPTSPR